VTSEQANKLEELVNGPSRKDEDREIVAIILGVLVVPIIVILPYREVQLPRPALIAMAVTLGFVCAKFSTEEYHKLLIVYAVYAPFSKVMAGDFDQIMTAFNLTNIFLLFMVGGWLAKGVVWNQSVYRRHPLDIPLALFMLISSLSLLRAGFYGIEPTTRELILQLKRWLFPMFLYFIAVNTLENKRQLRWLMMAVCITTVVVGGLGIKEYYLDKNAGFGMREVKKRIVVTSGPNNLGAFFCYYSPFIFAYFLVRMKSLLAWFRELPAFLIAMQAMRLTFSRGAQIGFAAAAIACVYLRKRLFFVLFVVPLLTLMIFVPQLIPKQCYGRLAKTYSAARAQQAGTLEGGLDKSSSDRIKIWRAGLEIIRDHPFVGVGYKNFRHVIGSYMDYKPGFINRDPHNTYLSIAAEMGLPALVVFLWVMVLMLKTGVYVYRNSQDLSLKIYSLGYVGGMVGLLITNIFGSRLDSAEITAQFWLLTGGIYVAREIVQKQIEEREGEHPEQDSVGHERIANAQNYL